MITNKDIRVESGNLVLNGDKYPLDGQSPSTIMEIVSENSDTTPTAESANPVTSGGVYNALEELEDDIIAEYIEDESISTSIAASSFGSYNIDCTKQGYDPVAIGEIYYGGESALLLSRYVINRTNKIATVFFYNITANAFTPSKISVKIIYKKL